MSRQQDLNEQFLNSPGRANTHVEGGKDDFLIETQKNRFLTFYLEILDNFEHKRKQTSACWYAILVGTFFGVIAFMKCSYESHIPLMEVSFVSVLVMFIINFQLITTSEIQPYISDEALNTTVKKTAISILLSLVMLITSLQSSHPSISVCFYLCGSMLGVAYEKFYLSQEIEQQELLMTAVTFGGVIISLGLPQLVLFDLATIDSEELKCFALALMGGACLVYTGESLKKLQQQNILTITHVIGLITIIFLPLFFPVEGLKSPSIIDWLYFLLVAMGLMIFVPVLVKAFTLERQFLVILLLSWSIPVQKGLLILVNGLPSLSEIIGSAAIVVGSAFLLHLQKERVHTGSFFIVRDGVEPKVKGEAEMQIWKVKSIE